MLLAAGAAVNIWDGKNETPLHCATSGGPRSREMMELLVNNTGDINAGLDKDGGSVLHSAVR